MIIPAMGALPSRPCCRCSRRLCRSPRGQAPARTHDRSARARVKRLLIRGAMVIPGTGVPASGPLDVLVENGTIARMGNATAEKWPEADAVIDGAGKYADARHRQHAHALARRARRSDSDSVRAQPVPRVWCHHGARGWWCLREDQTVARRERGSHDRGATNRAVSHAAGSRCRRASRSAVHRRSFAPWCVRRRSGARTASS